MALKMTWLDGSTINHDAWSVEASHCHDCTRHILIAAGNGDVPIVPLGRHDGLDAVRNQVPGLEAEAHPPRAHRDGVADADRVEPEPDHAGLPHALLHGLGEAEQVHVAGVALVPDRGDPDLGLREVVIGEADAVEDGLGATLRLGLGDAGAVLVELVGLGGQRGRRHGRRRRGSRRR